MRKPRSDGSEQRISGARPSAMRRLAVVFPGEPNDRLLAATTTWLADPLIAEASACAGVDIARALSGRAIMGAALVQPAVVALQLVGWRRLRARGLVPTLVAGQAAGEIAAWAAGGAIHEHDAIKLAAFRGAAVQLASLVHPTTRRASPGGWNTIAMAPARDALMIAASSVPRFARDIAQISSLDGSVLVGDDAPDIGAQLIEPAAWRSVIDSFLRFAITDVVVLPPSRTLRNMLRDAFGDAVQVHAAEDDADLERITENLSPPKTEAKKEAAAS